MVSGNPCCPRVDPVANRNLSISFVYSYEQRSSFQNKPPTVFETWFDLVEVSQHIRHNIGCACTSSRFSCHLWGG